MDSNNIYSVEVHKLIKQTDETISRVKCFLLQQTNRQVAEKYIQTFTSYGVIKDEVSIHNLLMDTINFVDTNSSNIHGFGQSNVN